MPDEGTCSGAGTSYSYDDEDEDAEDEEEEEAMAAAAKHDDSSMREERATDIDQAILL
jgi:hypothetical protein